MTKKLPDTLNALPDWKIAGFIIAYFLASGLLIIPVEFVLGYDATSILVIPVLEELLKLYLAMRHRQHAFYAIVLFAMFEVLLVKAPLLYSEIGSYSFTTSVGFVMVAFLFHLATAFAYTAHAARRVVLLIFSGCTLLHITYNSIDLLFSTTAVLLASSVLVALLPFLVAAAARWSCSKATLKSSNSP